MKYFFLNNKPAIYANLSIVIRLFAGPLTLLMLSLKISEYEQGIFFSFLSIAAFQIVFEIGITTVLVQFISAENNKKSLLYYSCLKMAFYWCLCAGLLFSVCSFLLSLFVFSDVELVGLRYQSAVYIFFIGINICLNCIYIIHEGNLDVLFVYKTRLQCSLVSTLFLWAGLWFDFGLWALAFMQVGLFLPLILKRKTAETFYLLFSIKKYSLKYALSKTWGFQSKIAMVWISGYLYWNSPVIILFKYVDPVYAGKFGLAFSLLNAINQAGQAWVTTKRARIGSLISMGEYKAARRIFDKSSLVSLVVVATGVLLVLGFKYALEDLSVFSRMLHIEQLAIMGMFFILLSRQSNLATYTRCFKNEPLFHIFILLNFSVPIILIGSNIFDAVYLGLMLTALIHIPVALMIERKVFKFERSYSRLKATGKAL